MKKANARGVSTKVATAVVRASHLQQQPTPTQQPKKASKSSSGDLTSAQLKELAKKLQSLQAEMRTQIEDRQLLVVNATFQAESLIKGDDAEVAEKQRVSSAALQELDILKNRLGLVQRALAKLKAGAYGFCEETDEPIGYDRLLVVPWARFAVHVQEVRERKMREFRVNRLRAEA